MRKIVWALGALALLGGTAGAAPAVYGEDHRLNRWGFYVAGTDERAIAYAYCPGDRIVSVNRRRTAGDWATGIVTAGVYTPEHVTILCKLR